MVPQAALTAEPTGNLCAGKTPGARQKEGPMYIGLGAVLAIILIIILLAFVF
jgi:hypothetical protein